MTSAPMVTINKSAEEPRARVANSGAEASKDMFGVARRSAVNTSELGLYSDRGEYYSSTNVHGSAIRKLVIGTMVVVTVILIGIFLYDFASSASIKSKVNQETKHIYILQNRLKNVHNGTLKKSIVTLAPTIFIVNSSDKNIFKDRIDNDNNLEYADLTSTTEIGLQKINADGSNFIMKNLKNVNTRKNTLNWQSDGKNVLNHNKQTISNHAMIYRIRSRYSSSEMDNQVNKEGNYDEAARIQFELNDSKVKSIKRKRYPQLTQYQYPHTSRNIQDIIKYFNNDLDNVNRDIKFTGFYIGEKKYDNSIVDTDEIAMSNSLYRNQEHFPYTMNYNSDPLYYYRPNNPSDVNLLANSNVRFSPLKVIGYNLKNHPYYQGITLNNHSNKKNEYDNDTLSFLKYHKKQEKPKPFTLTLDVYPVTDSFEETNKSSLHKPKIINYESRKPTDSLLEKYSNLYRMYTQSSRPFFMQNQQQKSEQIEKHEMILHLNLYPKQKSKITR